MSATETARAADEERDIKVPGKLADAKTGEKIVSALKKWAERNGRAD
ncbi:MULTISPECIES: hypothetical protein [unclassified Mesorhizobium]|nr:MULTISPECIES: hypothetical protein [unclassified Mesorhizobium]